MANVAKNRVHLDEEVEDLHLKGKKHFDEVHQANEGKRIAEANLANIERCIKRDQENFQAERDNWKNEKIGLIAAKDDAALAKLAAEARPTDAENRVAELLARLAEVEKLARTEEEWFNS